METFVEKFLGRNYHLALLVVILSFLLCLWGHMTGGEFVTLVGGVFTSFRAGDAFVNWIHRNDESRGVGKSHLPASFPLTGNQDTNDEHQ